MRRIVFALALPLVLAGYVAVVASASDPTVSTDKTDYLPGETATISGSGFAAGETVALQVAHITGEVEDGAGHEPWSVVADESGSFSSYWYVNPDDSIGATFLLTATGDAGSFAQSTFTDGPNDPILTGPASADGIQPVLFLGNQTCATLTPLASGEAKVEPVTSGTYTFGGVSVTLTVTNSPAGQLVSWTSTLGVSSVFVKGGNAGNLYTYPAEDYGDANLHSPINPNNKQYFGLSHVSFCYDRDLTVAKTATTSLDRTYSWDITKSGDNTFNKFIGDAASVNNYSVNVDRTVTDSNWAAAGTITIVNDTPDTATLTAVDDVIWPAIGGNVTCPGGLPQSLASGATLTCSYSAALPDAADRINTATVLTSGSVAGGAAQAAVSFGTAVVSEYGFPAVTVTDNGSPLGNAANDAAFNYSKDFSCPADPSAYTGGKHSFTFANTATITETGQSDSALVTVNCYAPTVTKDAATSYARDHRWMIEKTASPDSLSGFIGGSAGSTTWTIAVTETETESGFTVAGTIAVNNPNPFAAMSVSVAESLAGAVLDCGGALIVPAAGSATCGYSAATGKEDGTNTATVTLNGIGFNASAPFSFADATVTVTGAPTIHVSDSNGQGSEEFSASGSFSYPQSFACSANPGDYTNGIASKVAGNTATIDETDQSDDASVTITCYAPSIAKTAATSYTRKHEWTINKSVTTQSSFTGFPGQSFGFGYNVTVDETETEYDFTVSGVITVNNPNPGAPLTVAVADPGATLSCGGALTVPAGGSATCDYSTPTTKQDGVNTATASINGVDFTAAAAYSFGEPTTVIGPPVVSVTDTQASLGSTDGDYAWTYSVPRGCSTNTNDYINGIDNDSYPNTATIVETGQSSSAGVSVTCYIPAKANVTKTTTEGSQPIGASGFTFSLQAGGAEIEQAATNGAGSVMFTTDLINEGSYSVVELLPAGWFNATLTCHFDIDYPAAAGTVVNCQFHNREAGRTTVLKYTEGQVDPTQTWTFNLYAGPNAACGNPGTPACASFLGAPLASSGTANDLDGLLEFAHTNLDPNTAYTICEMGAPAGWSSLWMLDTNRDGTFDLNTEIVTPYNPNASDVPAQDLGTRCVDFTPAAGEISAFNVNNTFPGGEPRTIGYWKNWASCSNSGGNQLATAAKNGGADAGWFILDNLIPQTIGDLYVDACSEGVSLVSKQSLDGRNRASDAAYELAAQLLAAKLNLAAGAETCGAVQQAVIDGQLLLDTIGFTGQGAFLPSNVKGANVALRAQALALAATLDNYNNGNLCQ